MFGRTANPVDVDTIGFEAVARRSWRRVEWVLGYTALTKRPDYGGALVDASFYALNYARQRVTAAAIVRLARGVELRLDNQARLQAPNSLRTAGGDSAVLSTLSAAYDPARWPGLEFTVSVENVWNSGFQEIPSVPAAPRQEAIGVSYAW